MLFIGQTRFSLYNPNTSAWKASNGSRFKNEREYRKYLFSDERLGMRAEIFFDMSLPLLAEASRGFDVRHLISYSDYLPRKYQRMLQDAAKSHDFLILDKQKTKVPAQTVESVARGILLGTNTNDPHQSFGSYRLDDDDLLPVDFFQRNEPYIRPENVGSIVSFGTGLTAIYMDGKFYNARRCYSPMVAIGLMGINKFADDGTLVSPVPIGHNRSDRANPVILDSREIGYMWTRHVEQDSTLGSATIDNDKLLQRIRKHIDPHPPATDAEEIARHFPLIADRISPAFGPGSTLEAPITSKTMIPEGGVVLGLQDLRGEIHFKVELTCDVSTEMRNALVSFVLIDEATGEVANPEKWAVPLREVWVSTSGNPEVGFYKYLNTGPGKQNTRFKVLLPEGLTMKGAKVMKWRRQKSPISINAITVTSSK